MARILIIDDDPAIRTGAELVLCALGFQTEGADSGRAGLRRMAEWRPDLVLCAILMEDMDGFEVIAAAGRDPRLARIPFLLLTSLPDGAALHKSLPSGAGDFLRKPFRPEELLEAVQRRLGN